MIVDDLKKSILNSFFNIENNKDYNNGTVGKFSDFYDVTMGQSPTGSSLNSDNGIKFHQGKIFFTDNIIGKSDKKTSSPKKLAHNGDTILSVRAPVGDVNLCDREICIGRGQAAIRDHNIQADYKYVLYLLRYLKEEFAKKATGTTFKAITVKTIQNQTIFYHNISIQRNIVDKIDKLFSKLDEIKPIETSLNNLKKSISNNMKKSILNDILSKYDNLIELNKIAVINGGYAFKSTNYCSEGIRIIRISDFDEYGIKDDNAVRYKYDNSLIPYKLNNGDIIICMTGGTVGKNVILDNIPDDYYTNQRVATIKVNNNFIPKFVYYCINAPFIQHMLQNSKNSKNDNISMPLIKSFPIPNISIEEQNNVIEKIEQLLPLCSDIEKIVNS